MLACCACGVKCDEVVLAPRGHPRLDVAVCIACAPVLETAWCEVDGDGDEVDCTVCGRGGEVVLCDAAACRRTVHAACLEAVLGTEGACAALRCLEFACPSCGPQSAALCDLRERTRRAITALEETPCRRLEEADLLLSEAKDDDTAGLGVEALLVVESAIAEALETLEAENLLRLRAEVAAELGDDSARVDAEVATFVEIWDRRLDVLRLRQPGVQDLASRAGVALDRFYTHLDGHLEAAATTNVSWRLAPRLGAAEDDAHADAARTATRQADQALDRAGRGATRATDGRAVCGYGGAAGLAAKRRSELGDELYDRVYDASTVADVADGDLIAAVRLRAKATTAKATSGDDDVLVYDTSDDEASLDDDEEMGVDVLDDGPPSHPGASTAAGLAALAADDAALERFQGPVRRKVRADTRATAASGLAADDAPLDRSPVLRRAGKLASSDDDEEADEGVVRRRRRAGAPKEVDNAAADQERTDADMKPPALAADDDNDLIEASSVESEAAMQPQRRRLKRNVRSPAGRRKGGDDDEEDLDSEEDALAAAAAAAAATTTTTHAKGTAGRRLKRNVRSPATKGVRGGDDEEDFDSDEEAALAASTNKEAGATKRQRLGTTTTTTTEAAPLVIEILSSDEEKAHKEEVPADHRQPMEKGDVCWTCGDRADLLLVCEGCRSQHHLACVGLRDEPSSLEWFCSRRCRDSAAKKKTRRAAKTPKKEVRLASDAAREKQVHDAEKLQAKADRVSARNATEPTKEARQRERDRQDEVRYAVAEDSSEDEADADAKDDDVDLVLLEDRATEESESLRVVLPNGRKVLKSHQRSGLRVVCDNVLVSLEALRRGDPGFGVVIAHAMGLGKTLLAVALVTAVVGPASQAVRAASTAGGKRLDRILIVAPPSTLDNWIRELEEWSAKMVAPPPKKAPDNKVVKKKKMMMKKAPRRGRKRRGESDGDDGDSSEEEVAKKSARQKPWLSQAVGAKVRLLALQRLATTVKARQAVVKKWAADGGVLVVGFEMVSALLIGARRARDREFMVKHLAAAADIVIVDEAHRLKAMDSRAATAMGLFETRRRLALTGTPIQNNLGEYYTLCSWVRPNHLGTRPEFERRFDAPIRQGLYDDSTKGQIRKAKRKMALLHTLLEPWLHRRTAALLTKALPPKVELVVYVRLTNLQKRVYRERHAIGFDQGGAAASIPGGRGVFSMFEHMRQIYNHPHVALLSKLHNDALAVDEKRAERAAMARFVVGTDDEESSDDGASVASSEDLEVDPVAIAAAAAAEEKKQQQHAAFKAGGSDEGDEAGDLATTARVEWARRLEEQVKLEDGTASTVYDASRKTAPDQSAKALLTLEILRAAAARREKVLVFSHSLRTLDYLQNYVISETLGWPGSQCLRLDGSVAVQRRQTLVDRFNDAADASTVFLLSNKAAGVGLNLVGATRVILFDCSWNPASDAQAIARAHRYGQSRPVFVYRLVAAGTVEERVFHRQISKGAVASGVSDDEVLQRFFRKEQLVDLFPLDDEKYDDAKDAAAAAAKDGDDGGGDDAAAESIAQATSASTGDRLFRDLAANHGPHIARVRPFDTFTQTDDDRIPPEDVEEALAFYEKDIDVDDVALPPEEHQQPPLQQQFHQDGILVPPPGHFLVGPPPNHMNGMMPWPPMMMPPPPQPMHYGGLAPPNNFGGFVMPPPHTMAPPTNNMMMMMSPPPAPPPVNNHLTQATL